jgi:hypothetical protein
VKIIRQRTGRFVVLLSPQEKEVLFAVMSLYPQVPAEHHPRRKPAKADDAVESQKLLEEALESHRLENRRALEDLLKDPARVREMKTGWRIVLSPGDVEWFLQVLNDVRVGMWVLLGSPDVELGQIQPTEENIGYLSVLTLADRFQVRVLEALRGAESA